MQSEQARERVWRVDIRCLQSLAEETHVVRTSHLVVVLFQDNLLQHVIKVLVKNPRQPSR